MTAYLRSLVGTVVTVRDSDGSYRAKAVRFVPADTWVDVPEHPAKIRLSPTPADRMLIHSPELDLWAAVPVERIEEVAEEQQELEI